MVPSAAVDGKVDVVDDGLDADGKKVKVPSMSRMLKSRLTKLVEKADDTSVVHTLSNLLVSLSTHLQRSNNINGIHGASKQKALASVL
jgi:hypothetical protein